MSIIHKIYENMQELEESHILPLKKGGLPMPATTPKQIELNHPVGSVQGNKVKVEARDEVTREKVGEHWHKGSSGLKLSSSGHPISAKDPQDAG